MYSSDACIQVCTVDYDYDDDDDDKSDVDVVNRDTQKRHAQQKTITPTHLSISRNYKLITLLLYYIYIQYYDTFLIYINTQFIYIYRHTFSSLMCTFCTYPQRPPSSYCYAYGENKDR